jgi:hypothetical protein
MVLSQERLEAAGFTPLELLASVRRIVGNSEDCRIWAMTDLEKCLVVLSSSHKQVVLTMSLQYFHFHPEEVQQE